MYKAALTFFLLAITPFSAGALGIASTGGNSGGLIQSRYIRLCMQILECRLEQERERAQRLARKEERELWLATPRQPRPPISEWEIMHEKLKGVKMLSPKVKKD